MRSQLILFLLAVPVMLGVSAASLCASESEGGTEITDASGTVHRVSGIRYCYEEPEGDQVYINKFDFFSIQQGEAVIRLDFKKMEVLVFKGKPIEKKGRLSRPAQLVMEHGVSHDIQILFRPDAFFLGQTELGELRIDFAKVEQILFDHNKGDASATFEGRLFPRAEVPGGTLPVTLLEDGTLRLDGVEGAPEKKMLERHLARHDHTVFLKAEAGLTYPVLVQHLKALRQAGAKSFFFGP